MIAHIKGALLSIAQESVIVDVHGVGYEIFISAECLRGMPSIGEEVSLVIYTDVRGKTRAWATACNGRISIRYAINRSAGQGSPSY